eukprot:scaffold38821_cov51-Phaeocystis_antarctica.AAC.2
MDLRAAGLVAWGCSRLRSRVRIASDEVRSSSSACRSPSSRSCWMSTGSSAVVASSSEGGVVLPSEVVELAKVTTTEGLLVGHSCVAAPSIGASDVRDGSLAAALHIRGAECECGHLSSPVGNPIDAAACDVTWLSLTSICTRTDRRWNKHSRLLQSADSRLVLPRPVYQCP